MNLYPRRFFFILFGFFLAVLYPLRYLTLSQDTYSFQFVKFDISADLIGLNLSYLAAFILLQLSLGFFIPKVFHINCNKKLIDFLQKIFYLETFLLFIVVLLGVRAGVNQTIVDKIILFFVYSLIPINLIYFFLNITQIKNKWNTVLFLIPTILMASKSGMIFALLLILSAKILKKEKIINVKIIFGFLTVFLSYPVLITISAYHRFGTGNFFTFFISNLSNMGEDVLSLYGFVLTSISRRVSGLDVLMIPSVPDNFVFSITSILLYIMKGIFTASVVDGILSLDSFGIGRAFAIEFLQQSKDLANGFEPTLYGIVFHSPNPLISTVILYILCLLPILFLKYQKSSIALLLLCYFVFVYVFVFMTGTIVQLSQVFRFYIVIYSLYYIYKKVSFKWKK